VPPCATVRRVAEEALRLYLDDDRGIIAIGRDGMRDREMRRCRMAMEDMRRRLSRGRWARCFHAQHACSHTLQARGAVHEMRVAETYKGPLETGTALPLRVRDEKLINVRRALREFT
jgi:hypothetical protein